MANTIKLKTGSGSDPSASDLVVGELAIRTDSGKIFLKKDNGAVAEVSGGGGIDDGDKGDITVSNGGDTFTIDSGVVTESKIGDNSITLAKMANNSVDTNELVSGAVTNAKVNASAAIAGTKISPDFGSQNITTSGTISATGNGMTISGSSASLTLTDDNNNPDYRVQNNNGQFRIFDFTNSANRFSINSSGVVDIAGNLDVGAGLDVTGNISCSGTVDGVDIAARDTLFGGLTSSSGVLTNGVTGTTQGASDNTTKVATTAYVTTAISNLINGAPSALDTLNELAAAMNDDAAFSTTVTNSLATKMPLAGGQFTGNITFSGSQTVDGRDLSVDGTKLDGIASGATNVSNTNQLTNGAGFLTSVGTSNIADDAVTFDKIAHIPTSRIVGRSTSGTGTLEAMTASTLRTLINVEDGATADQSASEILTLIKTVDGAGSGLDADTLDGISSASFLRSDADDTTTGNLVISNKYLRTGRPVSDIASMVRTNTALEVSSLGVDHTASQTNVMRLLRDGTNSVVYAGAADFDLYRHTASGTAPNVGLEIKLSTTNTSTYYSALKLQSNGVIETGGNTVWHAGNDGSGSGLDSDLLDGQEGYYYRNASNLNAGTISDDRLPATISSDITGSAATLTNARSIAGTSFNGSASIDISYTNLTNKLSVGDGGLTQNNFTNADHSKLDGIEASATADQTASEILTLIKTVDGSGSGLDADTLDGVQASALVAVGGDTMTGALRVDISSSVDGILGEAYSSYFGLKHSNQTLNSEYMILSQDTHTFISASSGSDVYIRGGGNSSTNQLIVSTGGVTIGGNTVLTTASGLNASNVNSGTISDARLPNSISSSITGNAATATQLANARTIAGVSFNGTANISLNNNAITNGAGYITSADGGNAATLDSLDSTAFLRSNAADTASGDITFSGGAGAVTVAANSDITLNNGNWTGNAAGKIQHHNNILYFIGGSGGFKFRESGTDRWNIDGSGHFTPHADSTYNIGTNSVRVANGYFDTLYGDGSNLTGISAGATGGGSDEVFYENGQTVTTNYTITNGKNAMAAGPITINSGVTVTVGSGETLTIV